MLVYLIEIKPENTGLHIDFGAAVLSVPETKNEQVIARRVMELVMQAVREMKNTAPIRITIREIYQDDPAIAK